MGSFNQYYLDGPDLQSSTAAYSDAALTTAAADGFYSDGNIVREQLNGLFVTTQPCPSCEAECDTQVTVPFSRSSGYYTSTFQLGTSTGVVRIVFNPNSCAKGFRFKVNGVNYNEVSTQGYGYKISTAGQNYTVLGNFNNAGCGNPTPGNYNINIFKLQGGVFQQQPGTELVAYQAGDNCTTFDVPGNCVGYFRKTTPTDLPLEVQIASTYTSADGFDITIECPTVLVASYYGADCGEECPEDDTIFNIPVNGTPGVIGLYDWVFEDNMAQNAMPQGQYYICNIDSVITVSADGVVTNIVSCS